MTMSYTKVIFAFILFLFPSIFFAQDNFISFWQPGIALNYKVSKRYSHNFSIVHRNTIYDTNDLQFRLRQLDLIHFSNFNIGLNQVFSVGLLYRFADIYDAGRFNEFRTTQQYNFTKRPAIVRYGHRLRAEQRFSSINTLYRFRYRFTLDLPLEGETLDIKETYLIGSSETLVTLASGLSPIYGQRFNLIFGWLISEKTKLQGGPEYRLSNFTGDTLHQLFLMTSLVFSL